ncbi:MAG TPA: VWA domain-containing protein [Pyrinomonadaceae bacterium]|jgi:VWFA-related protein|nr:VWA domain-containing protein [Pyrinomonadaceae bacterium]
MKHVAILLIAILICSVATAQQQTGDDVVRVKANLVNIDVIVKDKKGKYIPDLKAEDFTIVENGVAQKIEFFDAPLARTEIRSLAAAAPEVATTTPGAARNYVALVLDSQTTDLTNLKQVREGTLKYVRDQITENDTVALLAVTNGLQMLQPFTQDKNKLIAALENAGLNSTSKGFEQKDIAENISSRQAELAAATAGGTITSTAGGSEAARIMIMRAVLAQFVRLRTALGLQQSRPILAALAAIAEGLRTIPGKKTVVLFSQGFVTPTVLDWQVQSTIDIANRANVAIYIIDSAGLRAGAPASGSLVPSTPLAGVSGIVDQEQRIRGVGGETVFDNVRQEGQNREYDILYRISGDTGGRFLKGNNDIGQGLERINEEIHARYTLAYRSTNQNFDGTFRKVKIDVKRPDAQIVSRSGYYAIPPEEIVPLSPADKKLLSGFAAAQANPELPVFVSLSQFRAREGLFTVPLAIELPPAAVKFERKGDKRAMQLDVLGVLKTTSDKILSRLGGTFDVNLTDADYQSIVNNNIFYRQDMVLAPGEYTLDLIVRDRQSGKTSAKREQFVVPEPDAEFAVTPVVLSRFVEQARLPLLAGDEPVDVFTHGRSQIRPSPGRQFQATDNLIMFLSVYNAANSPDTNKPLVRITVRLLKDGQPATKFFDFVLSEVQNQPVPHLTLAEYIRLAGLAPGNYVAAIEVKDMVTRKSVKQDAPFTIVP